MLQRILNGMGQNLCLLGIYILKTVKLSRVIYKTDHKCNLQLNVEEMIINQVSMSLLSAYFEKCRQSIRVLSRINSALQCFLLNSNYISELILRVSV